MSKGKASYYKDTPFHWSNPGLDGYPFPQYTPKSQHLTGSDPGDDEWNDDDEDDYTEFHLTVDIIILIAILAIAFAVLIPVGR